jgi:hypothetical protein
MIKSQLEDLIKKAEGKNIGRKLFFGAIVSTITWKGFKYATKSVSGIHKIQL